MDAAGDLLLLIPDYLNDTSQNVAGMESEPRLEVNKSW